jgi:hypothetical protein
LPEKKITPMGPKQETPGRLSRNFRINKLEKIFTEMIRNDRNDISTSIHSVWNFCGFF